MSGSDSVKYIAMMVIFLGIVFGSTVFTRTSTVRQYELIPFWSWKAIWKYRDWTLLKKCRSLTI